MNIKRLLLVLMVMGFAVGCSSTPEEDEGETAAAPVAAVEEEKCECDDADMKGALDPVEEDMGVKSYMVERGDNLWSISGKEAIYGNPYQWPLIYKANREQIKDADLIHPGQDLSIVRGMSEDEVNAAVNHAKTRGAWTLGDVEATDTAYLNE
ncbi:MAG: LysM peptidoglycan-binding domain-containing protein [Gammaproteobacteria bacterium]|nr:LysM peptidoglycan-binding domain-containing protein [Gammaproteobacteria bacterium]